MCYRYSRSIAEFEFIQTFQVINYQMIFCILFQAIILSLNGLNYIDIIQAYGVKISYNGHKGMYPIYTWSKFSVGYNKGAFSRKVILTFRISRVLVQNGE